MGAVVPGTFAREIRKVEKFELFRLHLGGNKFIY